MVEASLPSRVIDAGGEHQRNHSSEPIRKAAQGCQGRPEAVGAEGRVYAVDVDDEVVGELARRFPPESTNVETVLAKLEDPMLPDGSLDLVLIVNTYHHIEDRPAYFRKLKRDLRPGGRVAVIDPNQDLGGILGLTLDEGHKSSAPVVEQEMLEAGYRVDARHDFLPVQIFRVFATDPDAG